MTNKCLGKYNIYIKNGGNTFINNTGKRHNTNFRTKNKGHNIQYENFLNLF